MGSQHLVRRSQNAENARQRRERYEEALKEIKG